MPIIPKRGLLVGLVSTPMSSPSLETAAPYSGMLKSYGVRWCAS